MRRTGCQYVSPPELGSRGRGLGQGRTSPLSPDALKNDLTILTKQDGSTGTPPDPPPATGDVVLYASEAPFVAGSWIVTADTTAGGGARLRNPNASAAKITTALAAPANYFEMTFNAEAGRAYRLWLRGQADSNNWANDSAFVQFSDAVDQNGASVYQIGTRSASSSARTACRSTKSCWHRRRSSAPLRARSRTTRRFFKNNSPRRPDSRDGGRHALREERPSDSL